MTGALHKRTRATDGAGLNGHNAVSDDQRGLLSSAKIYTMDPYEFKDRTALVTIKRKRKYQQVSRVNDAVCIIKTTAKQQIKVPLTQVVERHMAFTRVKYPFLHKSQVKGMTLKFLGLPNLMGEIPRTQIKNQRSKHCKHSKPLRPAWLVPELAINYLAMFDYSQLLRQFVNTLHISGKPQHQGLSVQADFTVEEPFVNSNISQDLIDSDGRISEFSSDDYDSSQPSSKKMKRPVGTKTDETWRLASVDSVKKKLTFSPRLQIHHNNEAQHNTHKNCFDSSIASSVDQAENECMERGLFDEPIVTKQKVKRNRNRRVKKQVPSTSISDDSDSESDVFKRVTRSASKKQNIARCVENHIEIQNTQNKNAEISLTHHVLSSEATDDLAAKNECTPDHVRRIVSNKDIEEYDNNDCRNSVVDLSGDEQECHQNKEEESCAKVLSEKTYSSIFNKNYESSKRTKISNTKITKPVSKLSLKSKITKEFNSNKSKSPNTSEPINKAVLQENELLKKKKDANQTPQLFDTPIKILEENKISESCSPESLEVSIYSQVESKTSPIITLKTPETLLFLSENDDFHVETETEAEDSEYAGVITTAPEQHTQRKPCQSPETLEIDINSSLESETDQQQPSAANSSADENLNDSEQAGIISESCEESDSTMTPKQNPALSEPQQSAVSEYNSESEADQQPSAANSSADENLNDSEQDGIISESCEEKDNTMSPKQNPALSEPQQSEINEYDSESEADQQPSAAYSSADENLSDSEQDDIISESCDESDNTMSPKQNPALSEPQQSAVSEHDSESDLSENETSDGNSVDSVIPKRTLKRGMDSIGMGRKTPHVVADANSGPMQQKQKQQKNKTSEGIKRSKLCNQGVEEHVDSPDVAEPSLMKKRKNLAKISDGVRYSTKYDASESDNVSRISHTPKRKRSDVVEDSVDENAFSDTEVEHIGQEFQGKNKRHKISEGLKKNVPQSELEMEVSNDSTSESGNDIESELSQQESLPIERQKCSQRKSTPRYVPNVNIIPEEMNESEAESSTESISSPQVETRNNVILETPESNSQATFTPALESNESESDAESFNKAISPDTLPERNPDEDVDDDESYEMESIFSKATSKAKRNKSAGGSSKYCTSDDTGTDSVVFRRYETRGTRNSYVSRIALDLPQINPSTKVSRYLSNSQEGYLSQSQEPEAGHYVVQNTRGSGRSSRTESVSSTRSLLANLFDRDDKTPGRQCSSRTKRTPFQNKTKATRK